MSEVDVYKRIGENRHKLSKSHKKIANYLVDHRESVPFLTAAKLATLTGVGEATVIRFAVFLGYKGYPDLQRHLQEAMQKKLTSAEVLARTIGDNEEPKYVLNEVMTDDVHNLKATMQDIDPETFETVINELIQARRIYIVAYRSTASIGSFLAFYLDLVLQNTELIREADGVSEHLLDITSEDVVIGLGFSRYTKRTVEVMKYVQSREAKTVVITDHVLSPLIPYGDHRFITATEINSFIDSYAAPISLVNAMITALTRSEHKKIEARLQELEELWQTFDVFWD